MELRYALFSFAAFVCAMSSIITLATQKNSAIRVIATILNMFIIWLLIWGALS
jgi:hypothetical protein